MSLDNKPLLELIEDCEKQEKAIVINDGHVIKFEEEGEND